MVDIQEGMALLTSKTEAEAHLSDTLRLSCQAQVGAQEGAVRCHTMRRGAIQVVEEGCDLPRRTSDRPVEPAVTREGDVVSIDGKPVARWSGPLLGMAVDLGTTTVAARFVDLETGRSCGTVSFENPQRFGGSDVLARVAYDTEHKGQLLRRTLAGYLSHAIEDFGCEPMSLFEVVLAGNAAMRDLFFGLDVYSIGQMPYQSITEKEMRDGRRSSTAIHLPGRRSLLPMNPAGRVYGMPLVACHVGADTAACMLAIDLFEEERLVALMDIGTNTELILGRKGELHAASCPAGPAFEGGSISCGMPALDGAVERVRIAEDGRVECGVIGGGPAQGLCGSGLIDLASELVRTGVINRLGRYETGDDRFALAANPPVYLTEEDLSQLAQAKAANVAGLHLVHRNYGVDFADVEVFYLAGGFARHLDLAAARRIGLLPDLPEDRFVRIGNASLEGATAALKSATSRSRLETQLKSVRHIELETFPEFFHYFAEGVQFAAFDSHDQGPEIVT